MGSTRGKGNERKGREIKDHPYLSEVQSLIAKNIDCHEVCSCEIKVVTDLSQVEAPHPNTYHISTHTSERANKRLGNLPHSFSEFPLR